MKTILFLMTILTVVTMVGAVPQQINYQGFLTNPSGSALDTTVSMTFKLYTDSLAGSLLWTESRPSISVQKGLFSSRLGELAALNDAIMNHPQIWLGITVGNNTEMTPRIRMISVPYSYRTGSVDGAAGGQINGDLIVGPTNSANFVFRSFVAGDSNSIYSDYSTISGGQHNYTESNYTVIGGGRDNSITNDDAVIGGGRNNSATAIHSVVAGGAGNQANGTGSVVGGGLSNAALDSAAVVSGGSRNIASGLYSTVSGGRNNRARGQYAFVGGGGGASTADSNSAAGHFSAVAGGRGNAAEDSATTVCGGRDNRATGEYATVAGGQDNYVDHADWGVIGGGQNNRISIAYATVSGGQNNVGSGTFAMIPGGFGNTAGAVCFAAGRFARANGFGSFVWSSGGDTTASFASNSFTARAPGGVRFYTSTSAINVGASLAAGSGAWASLSDSTTKRRYGRVNSAEILRKVAELPIERWSYETQPDSIQHIGPMAQDFHALFHVGEDDKTISTIDPSGIALAAIQELAKENADLRARLTKLESQLLSIVGAEPKAMLETK